MKVKDVVILNEVADDFNDGRSFYDQKERGVGEYFWDSLIADRIPLYLCRDTQQKVWPLSNASQAIPLCHLLRSQ
jgi:hypothetical protein